MSVPYAVIDAGPAGEAATAAFIATAARGGWRVIDGFGARPAPHHVILRGTVATPRDAAAALLAALDGFGVLVRAAADSEVVDRLVDDLCRLGHVDQGVEGGARPAEALHADGRAILGLLAEGHSLGEAAHLLGLSRRTADRRLAAARRALGVQRTTEAIARAARHGWLRRPLGD